MNTYIDTFLNKFTTYRFTLYYLIAIYVFALIFCAFGILPFTIKDLLITSFIAIIVGYISNVVLATIIGVPRNVESVFITALILTLIIPAFQSEFVFIFFASGLAMASKYLITIDRRHIFNPAAVSVAAIALLSPSHVATWWIGSVYMLPIVAIGGLLLIRKIGKEKMVYAFLETYLILTIIASIINKVPISTAVNLSILNSPVFFLAFVMLTEPITSPSREKMQYYYAIFAAIAFSTPELKIFNIGFTPELSLCGANLFAYIINPNYRIDFILEKKEQLSKDTIYFIFKTRNKIRYLAGQYMEWILPHKKTDDRGNRRYFSFASSPTENSVSILVRFPDNPSSYKKALMNLQRGDKITATELAGDFILPSSVSKNSLVFIAGGVGIAPFISMIKYIIDKRIKTNITLIYSNKSQGDILFKDILKKAEYYGVKTIYTLTNPNENYGWYGEKGYIDQDLIKKHVPSYNSSMFYIAGAPIMVDNIHNNLIKMGVSPKQIKEDFFPGYIETKA